MWELQPFTILPAFTACYRDSFTYYPYLLCLFRWVHENPAFILWGKSLYDILFSLSWKLSFHQSLIWRGSAFIVGGEVVRYFCPMLTSTKTLYMLTGWRIHGVNEVISWGICTGTVCHVILLSTYYELMSKRELMSSLIAFIVTPGILCRLLLPNYLSWLTNEKMSRWKLFSEWQKYRCNQNSYRKRMNI
jgi:hypothetical protein